MAPPGVVGIAEVVKEAYPDPTAFDPQDKHFDPKSDPQNPRWLMVDMQLVRKFDRVITLLDNRIFDQTAPAEIVQKHRDRQTAAEAEMAVLRQRLETL